MLSKVFSKGEAKVQDEEIEGIWILLVDVLLGPLTDTQSLHSERENSSSI
jgi:hypothetical protein